MSAIPHKNPFGTLVAVYRSGKRWEIERDTLSEPTFQSGLCSLYLMQHTVVAQWGVPGVPNAWDAREGLPSKNDLVRIRSTFGAEACKAVEDKLLRGPA